MLSPCAQICCYEMRLREQVYNQCLSLAARSSIEQDNPSAFERHKVLASPSGSGAVISDSRIEEDEMIEVACFERKL